MDSTPAFRTVGQKERLVDRVVAEIERAIVAGELAPETNLPPERTLAAQLGVSRTVIREAVRILVAKGLLEARHGLGTVVRRVSRQQLAEPLSLLMQTSQGAITFEHLYQVRSILEIEIVRLAAQQATAADIAALGRAVAEMEAAQEDAILLAEKDAAFHHLLATLTHNPLLMLLTDSIFEVLREYVLLMAPHLDPSQDVLPFHRSVYERVAARDVEGAAQAMHEHFCKDQANRRRLVDDNGSLESI